LSIDEAREAIAALTTADLIRLKKVGALYAVGVGVDGLEVLNEAVRRALDGTRNCPGDVPMTVFLVNVMRSMASSERAKAKEEPMMESMSSTLDDGPAVLEPPSPTRNVEEMRLAREDAEGRLRALEDIFRDDDDAQLVLMGDVDEMSADEIRALGCWDEQAYATIRRRIRRKIAARYPQGWVQ
jgi:DNA-directed RNA polymerase specialized sigma24 family protein